MAPPPNVDQGLGHASGGSGEQSGEEQHDKKERGSGKTAKNSAHEAGHIGHWTTGGGEEEQYAPSEDAGQSCGGDRSPAAGGRRPGTSVRGTS